MSQLRLALSLYNQAKGGNSKREPPWAPPSVPDALLAYAVGPALGAHIIAAPAWAPVKALRFCGNGLAARFAPTLHRPAPLWDAGKCNKYLCWH